MQVTLLQRHERKGYISILVYGIIVFTMIGKASYLDITEPQIMSVVKSIMVEYKKYRSQQSNYNVPPA